MSVKLPAMFYHNPPHTFGKIVKTHNNIKHSQSLTPNVKVIAEIKNL